LKDKHPKFENNFDAEYERFKVGVMIESARHEAGLTQEQLASRM
jgi:ribosome-binding protein aMBF1 (putative translation factor)